MHRANNAVIMQTEQLGRIEALEEELCSLRAKMAEMELKTTEQDRVIAQLMGDNFKHLQDNMHLTTVIGRYFYSYFGPFLTQLHSTFLTPPFPLMLTPDMLIPLCLSAHEQDDKNKDSIGTTGHQTTRLLGY